MDLGSGLSAMIKRARRIATWCFAFCVGIGIASHSHAELPPWSEVAPVCARQVAEKLHCASCNGYWPQVAICTVAFSMPSAPPAEVTACIKRVQLTTTRLPLAHDRVADVFRCLSRVEN